ncbi:hypothetical protein [Actinopolyspora mortivallis]|uniref:Nuclear transport factor 2 family protein n=1 Tax=Actinopolyspora mortivallis TaxID=33906 RepID=A0A2T0GSC7_ACTMO|nr:hypothetical protein [Actinopolyspora mortivallis]PRW62004.1 hypothetical protein CEP50_17850 [Actinopolyspora mortivallis]
MLLGCLLCSGSAVTDRHGPRTPPRTAAEYFAANNAAAREGPRAQREFLRRTQHPDFREGMCVPDTTTITLDPVLTTLRPSPEFRVNGLRPDGRVRVVAVEATVRRSGEVVARRIGSKHLVLRQGRFYGFAPCLS